MRRKNAECPAPGLRSGCDGATCRSATSSASGHLICRTNPIFREAADHYMEVGIARRKRRMTQKASWRMEYWSVRILMSWALTALPFRNAGLIALNVFRASQRKVRVSLPECHDVNRNGPEEKRNFCRTNPNVRKYVRHNNMQRSKCTSGRRDPLTSRLTADTEGHPLTPTLSPSGGEGGGHDGASVVDPHPNPLPQWGRGRRFRVARFKGSKRECFIRRIQWLPKPATSQ